MTKLFSPKLRRYLYPFIGGLLYAAGFPMKLGPFEGIYFFLFPIIGFVFLLSAWNFSEFFNSPTKETFWTRILSTICFSIGYYTLGYYWIPYTISEFGSIPFPFNYLLGLVFSLVILPQYYVFLVIHYALEKVNLKNNFAFKTSTQRHFLYAFLLTLCEYFVPQQFPAHMGHPWIALAPYLGLAPIFGAPLFSFISYWLSFSLCELAITRKKDLWCWTTALIFLIANIAFPLSQNPGPQEKMQKTHIRMVQGNIGNYLKIASEKGVGNTIEKVLQSFKDLSTGPSSKPLDLIIWPETSYPKLLSRELLKKGAHQTPTLFKEIIEETNADLFVGGYDRTSLTARGYYETEYNTAFHFNNQKEFEKVYHKIKLIPFGESLPFGPINDFLSRYVQNISYFAKGDTYALFETSKGVPFTAAICYEILFSDFVRDYLNTVNKHPHFIVNLTNDSWYGDTSEPLQHLFLAKWRALEFQLPIARMTNTGITSVLYPDGTESRRLGVGQKTHLDVTLKTTKNNKTPFQAYGLWPFILIGATLFSVLTLRLTRYCYRKERGTFWQHLLAPFGKTRKANLFFKFLVRSLLLRGHGGG